MGIANEDGLVANFSFPGNNEHTADSLGLIFLSACSHALGGKPEIKACVVSSVVPGLDPMISEAMSRYLDCRTWFAGKDVPVPLENDYPRPGEVGADILVGAYEARRCFTEKSLIVVDYGTAVTFANVVDNVFKGGLVFPGPGTAMTALALNTARLPQVDLGYPGEKPEPCVDTSTSIRHGLMFGYEALTRGLLDRLKAGLPGPVATVATGGFAKAMNRFEGLFDHVVPTLVLDGLARLYKSEIQSTQE